MFIILVIYSRFWIHQYSISSILLHPTVIFRVRGQNCLLFSLYARCAALSLGHSAYSYWCQSAQSACLKATQVFLFTSEALLELRQVLPPLYFWQSKFPSLIFCPSVFPIVPFLPSVLWVISPYWCIHYIHFISYCLKPATLI
mgnify:CR=1 FL=1